MSDVVVRAQDLSKVYRLYRKPHHRLLDMLGLLSPTSDKFTEHAALDRIDLEIHRGEKVAIIGRNGAGKSTLLKLITKVTVPSEGSIEVNAKIHALLQIGTGFHPDFTGRENVSSYLSYLGVKGVEVPALIEAIVDFAELEEYIDQPVKTYSTGMSMRLMFAASTAITPEILVIDEVLGVGDAYFARKSYERISELADGHGTTVLLVTHDVYSASDLCNRMIWIERGRIVMDEPSFVVVKGYEDSIREQEERRLRLKKLTQMEEAGITTEPSAAKLLVEIHGADNRPQSCPVYFSRVSLKIDGAKVGSLPFGPEAFEADRPNHLMSENSCWGADTLWHGRQARPMENYGSPFHKSGGVFDITGFTLSTGEHQVELLVDYFSERPCELDLQAFVGELEIDFGKVPPSEGQWQSHAVARPISGGRAASGGARNNGLSLLTDSSDWGYQAHTAAFEVPDGYSIAVDLRGRIDRGAISIGILNESGTEWLGTTTLSSGRIDKRLEFDAHGSEKVSLVVSNAQVGSTRVVLDSVGVTMIPPQGRVEAGQLRTMAVLDWTKDAAQEFATGGERIDAVGTARIWISDVILMDGAGTPSFVLKHGEPIDLVADFEIRDPSLEEKAQVLVAFHRDGVTDVCRIVTRDLYFSGTGMRHGRIRLHLPRLYLGEGRFSLSLMIAEKDYYDSDASNIFYTINPGVYCCLSRLLEFDVIEAGTAAGGTGVVGDGEWSMVPSPDVTQEPEPAKPRTRP